MKSESRLLPTFVVAAACLSTGLVAAAFAHLATRRLVNETVFLKNYRRPFWEESLIFNKMDYVLRSGEANDTLFLGDSSCLMDLDPLRWTARTGRTAYNLGTMGWLASDGHLEILRAYLDHHPKPRLLVYLIWPGELTADSSSNEAFKDRFIWAYGPELRKERGFSRWPLEFRLREEFRTLVGLLAERRTRYFEREIAPGITHARLAALLAERRGFFALAAAKPVEPYDGDLRVAPLPGSRLEELLRFAQARGLRTLVRLAPVPGRVPDERKRELERWFSRLEIGPGIRVSHPLILEFPPSDFGDSRHLNATGVRRLTDIVVQESNNE